MTLDEALRAELRSNVYLAYVFDLGYEIKNRALETRVERDAAATTEDRSYQSGRVMAYGEVLALMRQMAIGLGIPLSHVRLDGVDDDEFV